MSLSIGIVGLPNVGKSTLFNALTNSEALAANYPFATIEPNTGIVPVPDSRLKKLSDLYNSEKIIPATIEFIDIAGLVSGASKGEGLGNKFLANIRECSAIIHVVRAFKNSDVTHVDSSVNPERDIETINTELILADIQSLENKLAKLSKEAKANPKIQAQSNTLEKVLASLKQGKLVNQITNLDNEALSGLNLLTAKPVIYVFNINEAQLDNQIELNNLANIVPDAPSIFICAKLEDELKGLDPSDAKELLDSYNIQTSGLNQLVRQAYKTLNLQSFLTAGPKEVRAWTIQQGATAPEAAGVIHTDFEKGFIAAQIVNFNDLIATGSLVEAKAAGKVRTEGKDYVMREGDIAEFRFNVSK